MNQLSEKDQQVLKTIFDRNSSRIKIFFFTLVVAIQSLNFSQGNNIDDIPIHSQNLNVRRLESEAVELAELGARENLIEALELLNEAIKIDPSDPSPYNNKAQVQRLLGEASALETLNEAIKLSQISRNDRVLRQSSAQRGWLNFREGNLVEASNDFKISSDLGCPESKRMLVRCNPYAAMCNQMLHELIGTSSTYYTKTHEINEQ